MVTESSSIWIRTASFLPPRDCDAEMLPSTPDGVLSEWIIRVPESVPMPELSSPLPPPPPPRADGPIESSDISLCDVFVGFGWLKRFGTNTWLVLFFDRLGWSQLMMIFGLFFFFFTIHARSQLHTKLNIQRHVRRNWVKLLKTDNTHSHTHKNPRRTIQTQHYWHDDLCTRSHLVMLRQQTLAAASFSVVELLSTALPSSFSQSWLYHPHRVCCWLVTCIQ